MKMDCLDIIHTVQAYSAHFRLFTQLKRHGLLPSLLVSYNSLAVNFNEASPSVNQPGGIR